MCFSTSKLCFIFVVRQQWHHPIRNMDLAICDVPFLVNEFKAIPNHGWDDLKPNHKRHVLLIMFMCSKANYGLLTSFINAGTKISSITNAILEDTALNNALYTEFELNGKFVDCVAELDLLKIEYMHTICNIPVNRGRAILIKCLKKLEEHQSILQDIYMYKAEDYLLKACKLEMSSFFADPIYEEGPCNVQLVNESVESGPAIENIIKSNIPIGELSDQLKCNATNSIQITTKNLKSLTLADNAKQMMIYKKLAHSLKIENVFELKKQDILSNLHKFIKDNGEYILVKGAVGNVEIKEESKDGKINNLSKTAVLDMHLGEFGIPQSCKIDLSSNSLAKSAHYYNPTLSQFKKDNVCVNGTLMHITDFLKSSHQFSAEQSQPFLDALNEYSFNITLSFSNPGNEFSVKYYKWTTKLHHDFWVCMKCKLPFHSQLVIKVYPEFASYAVVLEYDEATKQYTKVSDPSQPGPIFINNQKGNKFIGIDRSIVTSRKYFCRQPNSEAFLTGPNKFKKTKKMYRLKYDVSYPSKDWENKIAMKLPKAFDFKFIKTQQELNALFANHVE